MKDLQVLEGGIWPLNLDTLQMTDFTPHTSKDCIAKNGGNTEEPHEVVEGW
jgi:hypothetical protein